VFVPLVDILRCVNAHEDTWLVASIERAVERDIVRGTLGCPACHAEYAIRDGVVWFATDVTHAEATAPSEQDAVRVAAALGLTDPRMTAVLHGTWGAHAQLIRSMSPAQLLLVDPPEGIVSGDGISIVLANHAPIAHGAVNAVAIDASAGDAMRQSLRACLKPGGRMLGASATPIPPELTELVRDDDVWVAELPSENVSAPVSLGRRAKPVE
jgi:uncharacterized protein YbaR (Trm112 family)